MECSWEARLTSGRSSYTLKRTVRLLTRCAAASHGAELDKAFSAIAVTPCMSDGRCEAGLLGLLSGDDSTEGQSVATAITLRQSTALKPPKYACCGNQRHSTGRSHLVSLPEWAEAEQEHDGMRSYCSRTFALGTCHSLRDSGSSRSRFPSHTAASRCTPAA